MLTAPEAADLDATHDARVMGELAKLQIPYEEIAVKALDLLTHGLVKLRLVTSSPEPVFRLADALHRIPRSLNAESVDELRQHVAEAMVALDEL